MVASFANQPKLLQYEEKTPLLPPGGLWSAKVKQTVIMRLPSYVLPQRAAHFSEATLHLYLSGPTPEQR